MSETDYKTPHHFNLGLFFLVQKHQKLKGIRKAILQELALNAFWDNIAEDFNYALVYRTGFTPQQVSKALSYLIKHGYLKIIRRLHLPSLYCINKAKLLKESQFHLFPPENIIKAEVEYNPNRLVKEFDSE